MDSLETGKVLLFVTSMYLPESYGVMGQYLRHIKNNEGCNYVRVNAVMATNVSFRLTLDITGTQTRSRRAF